MAAAPPAISVLLAVRDGAAWLGETLDSLAAQTFTDFEVLVQDDGSTDGTRALAGAFAARDPRFRVESGPPRGVVSALNAAARRARGRLLLRSDADDPSRPERFARQWAHAEAHSEVDFLGCRVRYFPPERRTEGMARYEAWIDATLTHEAILADRYVECPLVASTWALRPALFERLGGYAEGPFPEDYDLFLRAVEAGARFAKLPERLVAMRLRPEGAMRTDPRFALERFRDLKLRHLVVWLRRDGRPVAVVGTGRDGKRWARRLRDAGVPVDRFVDARPERLGLEIHGAEVVGWERLGALCGHVLLSALGRPERRAAVRERLRTAGFVEQRDFWCVQ